MRALGGANDGQFRGLQDFDGISRRKDEHVTASAFNKYDSAKHAASIGAV